MKPAMRVLSALLSLLLPASTVACAPELFDPPVPPGFDGEVELIKADPLTWIEGKGNRQLNAISPHPEGGVVVAGAFDDELSLGGATLAAEAGATDPFVARLGPDGAATLLWSASAPDPQAALAVFVEDDGTTVVAGDMSGALPLGNGEVLQSVDGRDAFLVKDPGTGSALEGRVMGGIGYQIATSIAPGKPGEVLVGGRFSGKIVLDNQSFDSTGGYDAFVTTLDIKGKARWSAALSGASDERIAGIAAASDGNAFVVGDFVGKVNVSGSTETPDSQEQGGVFLAKFGAVGNVPWVIPLGGTGRTQAAGVAIDGEQNVLVAGSFSGSVDFGDAHFMTEADASLFVLKVNGSTKKIIWARAFGETGRTTARGIAIGAEGKIAVVSDYTGRVVVGTRNLESNGQEDLLVLELDTSGKALRTGSFGDAKAQRATGIACEKSGRMTVTGYESDVSEGPGEPFVLRMQ